MAIDVLFDVYITNEYGIVSRVTEEVNDYRETRSVDSLYNVCEFTLDDQNLPMALSQDGIERIRVERVIDGVSFSDSYLIDDMDVQDKLKTRIVGKTVGALLFEPYSLPKKETLNFDTYNEVLSYLLGGTPNSFRIDTIPDNTTFFDISNVSYGSAFISLSAKLGIDVYVRDGLVIVENFKTIHPYASPTQSFTQKDTSSATLNNKKSGGLGVIEINISNADIISEASMALKISAEPQAVRPNTPRTWLDPETADMYTIAPQVASLVMYFNPCNGAVPKITGMPFSLYGTDYAVEEFELSNETEIKLLGGIRNLLEISVTDGTESKPVSISGLPMRALNDGEEDIFIIKAVPSSADLGDGNGTTITLVNSGLDQPISSTITGSGTTIDPYIYEISLGSVNNTVGAKASAILEVASMYSFSIIREQITITAFDNGATLNGHNIKIDGTGLVQTSGYTHSAGETTFFLDPTKKYDSVARVIYSEIKGSSTLPYTATLDETQDDVALTPKNSVDTIGIMGDGEAEAYYGQRDNKAISSFIRLDPNVDGILTTESSTSEANITVLPEPMVTTGGVGDADTLDSRYMNWKYEYGHNILHSDFAIEGTVRVAYLTRCYKATSKNSTIVKNIGISATFKDCYLRHIHEIRAIDYFPLSYVYRMVVADAWGITDDEARGINITINKVAPYSGQSVGAGGVGGGAMGSSADQTGLFMLALGVYGQYVLTISGHPPLYVRFYANKFELSFDKIILKQATNEDDPENGGLC